MNYRTMRTEIVGEGRSCWTIQAHQSRHRLLRWFHFAEKNGLKIKLISSVAVVFLLTAAAVAQEYETGPIHLMSPWSRAMPPIAENGAAYLTLKNYGKVPDRLVAASSPIADRVEFHTHAMEGGTMAMRRIESVELAPGEYVTFEPGGKHLMLFGLNRPLKKGERFSLTLEFEKAPALEVVVKVQSMDAGQPEMTGHGHQEKHEHDKQH